MNPGLTDESPYGRFQFRNVPLHTEQGITGPVTD